MFKRIDSQGMDENSPWMPDLPDTWGVLRTWKVFEWAGFVATEWLPL